MAQVRIEMDQCWVWFPIVDVLSSEEVEREIEFIINSDLEDDNKFLAQKHFREKNTLTLDIPDALLSRFQKLEKEWSELQAVFEQMYRQQEGKDPIGQSKIPDYRIRK